MTEHHHGNLKCKLYMRDRDLLMKY